LRGICISVEVRVGRELEEFMMERLRRTEKRLWAASPWISKEFISILLEAKSRGVDIMLIITDDLTPHIVKPLSGSPSLKESW